MTRRTYHAIDAVILGASIVAAVVWFVLFVGRAWDHTMSGPRRAAPVSAPRETPAPDLEER